MKTVKIFFTLAITAIAFTGCSNQAENSDDIKTTNPISSPLFILLSPDSLATTFAFSEIC